MILVAGALAAAILGLGASPAVAGAREFVAELGRVQDIVEPDARGQAKFQLSDDGGELRFELTVENLENFVQAHIHLTPEALTQESILQRFRHAPSNDQHGPIVAFLTEFMRGGAMANRTVAKGVIRGSDLVGPLTGYPLSLLIELMEKGDTYVAVHVMQRVPPKHTFCCPIGLRAVIKAKRAQ